jgi:hypothetical protein
MPAGSRSIRATSTGPTGRKPAEAPISAAPHSQARTSTHTSSPGQS